MYGTPQQKQPLVATCVQELTLASNEIHILPDGKFRADDGRPFNVRHWELNPAIAKEVIQRAEARQRDTVIDYEHATMYTPVTGKAIAAGWWRKLEYRQGAGLYVTDARWTEAAKEHIRKKEYRYISAVFTYDQDTGAVLRILHLGVTNNPALDGLQEVELAAAAKFLTHQENDMKLHERICLALSIAATSSEDELVTALTAVLEENKNNKTVIVDLNSKLGLDASVDAAKTAEAIASLVQENKTNKEAIADLRSKSGEVDLSKYVSINTFDAVKKEVADLTSKLNNKEVDDMIDIAMGEGKLLPAQEEWARNLGKKDVAALKSYLDNAVAIPSLSGKKQTETLPLDKDGKVQLDADELAICKNMGIDEEAYRESKKQTASTSH